MEATLLELVQSPMIGLVQDLSTKGLCLQIPKPVAANSLVQVEINGAALLGLVRHIRPDQDRYRVGIQLQHSVHRLEQLREYNRLVLGEIRSLEAQNGNR